MTSNGIVQKLWNYCNVLRDDGLSYGDYVEQLTFLLFLNMADEQTKPPFNRKALIPKDLDWASLVRLDGDPLETQRAKNRGQRRTQIIEIMKGLPRAGQPGTIWNYSTGETQIVSELIRAAVKRPVSQYLSERIWAKFGMESDALWWLDSPNGQEIGGGGFNATLRDYGRFAQFVLNGGVVGGKSIVPDGWFAEAGSSKVINGKTVGYGYMWWIPDASANPVHQGAFMGRGIFGQSMYVNPKEKLVVVVLSARPKPTGTNTINDEDFIAAVVKALH